MTAGTHRPAQPGRGEQSRMHPTDRLEAEDCGVHRRDDLITVTLTDGTAVEAVEVKIDGGYIRCVIERRMQDTLGEERWFPAHRVTEVAGTRRAFTISYP